MPFGYSGRLFYAGQTMSDMTSYCQDMVEEEDHRRYLSLLFAPAHARPALFALYAFNLELAKTRDSVSEPMIGEIRLQWWREALDGIVDGQVRDHPVVTALADTADVQHLRSDLMQMIDARTHDLYDEGLENLGALWAYIDDTGASLGRCAAQILGAKEGPSMACAGAAGSAYAASGLLLAMAYEFANGRQALPQAELGGEGLDPSRPLAEEDAAAIRPILVQITQEIGRRIDLVRHADARTRRQLLPLVIQAGDARATLNRLTKMDYNPFQLAKDQEAPLLAFIRSVWAALRKRP